MTAFVLGVTAASTAVRVEAERVRRMSAKTGVAPTAAIDSGVA
jgi:hypothetical protein